jgi:predicted nucleic acid-binding protein
MSQKRKIFTTQQNVSEFWNVSTRPITARGGRGLSVSVVSQRVRAIERLCTVLESSSEVYQAWRHLLIHYNVSGVAVHDARIAATMIVNGIKEILTFNKKDFARYSELTALSPEEIPIT